jgi:1,4-alpha-glucan branching enzyme
MSTLPSTAVAAIVGADHGDPFAVLGRHGNSIRVIRTDAKEVAIVDATDPQKSWPAKRLNPAGFFEAQVGEVGRYRLRFTAHNGHVWEDEDPYTFGILLGELDQHLYAEGNHWQLWKVLGAHTEEHHGVRGTVFRVWAPNARRVSVVGEWNGWDGRVHPMRKLIPIGIWELFLPGVAEGTHYKFELLGHDGHLHVKSDPFAFYSEHGVKTASLVWSLENYQWSDDAWMERQRTTEWQRQPVSIYEVHPGSWRRKEEDRFLTWRELAVELLEYVVEMGYTHIELMGVAEYPFEGSWGYQVTGYFAPTSRYGTPDDFRFFVDRCHERGVGVILDWVPGHFPKDAHGLARFDGTSLYEHADPRQGEHQDWGTLIFNYGRNEVRNFLIANALFWLEEYHIDGLRVDAVASMLYLDYSRSHDQWIPNAYGGRENLDAIHFLKRCNEVCHERHPGMLTIAEESTAWPGVSRPTFLGGLGFSFKWNMGWMHDTLDYLSLDPVYRRFHQGQATFSLVYAFHEHFILVLSHDEVVHGKGSLLNKMPGDEWQQFANLRLLYGWMWAHPGKKLLFMGGEWGQRAEWNHERALDWWVLEFPVHAGIQRLIKDLNYLYRNERALFDQDDNWEGFEWIDLHDADNSVLTFLRRARHGTAIVFVINATPCARDGYRIGVPDPGYWREILNTDSEVYGGSNVGNLGGLHAEPTPWMNRSYSMTVRLPPLGVLAFKRNEG